MLITDSLVIYLNVLTTEQETGFSHDPLVFCLEPIEYGCEWGGLSEAIIYSNTI